MDENKYRELNAKLDKLTESVWRLVVLEERIGYLIAENKRDAEEVKKLKDAQEKIKLEVAENTRFTNSLSRGLWMIGTALVGIIAKIFFW